MRVLLGGALLIVASSITLSVLCYFLLVCRVSFEKSADNLLGVPLYIICCFSLVAFSILSLSLILIPVCRLVFLLRFILPGTLCTSWPRLTISFSVLGKSPAIFSSNIFSGPFSLSSPSCTPIMGMLVHLMLSQKSLRLSSFLFIPFLYPVLWQWFYHSVF